MTFKREGGSDYSGSPALPPVAATPALPGRGRHGSADAQQAGGQALGAPQAAEAHVPDLAVVACAVARQRAARCSRKSESKAVGRPVLPFCAPLW
jgi:hypothetical protein